MGTRDSKLAPLLATTNEKKPLISQVDLDKTFRHVYGVKSQPFMVVGSTYIDG